MNHGVSRETREGASTLNLVAVAQMTRTGKPETVSLTVNDPTRTYDQHTKSTLRAGSDGEAIDRVEHMQERKNNNVTKQNGLTVSLGAASSAFVCLRTRC